MAFIMNRSAAQYRIFSLGDGGVTIDFGNRIDEATNREVVARFEQIVQNPIRGMSEAVPAYSSLTVYYDIIKVKKLIPAGTTAFDYIKQELEQRLRLPFEQTIQRPGIIKIPVCYEHAFGQDIHYIADTKKISVEELIAIHTAWTYKVYMLGFLPGFSYLGEIDDRIAMPRKPQPQNVEAGSVGIAGKQTGIYPLASPGGWQIIGRTPLKLFDTQKEDPTLLQAGDTVQFYSISKNEFEEIKSKNEI